MSDKTSSLRAELEAACARIPRRMQFMEVCGTHTVSIFRSGIRSLLPDNLRLVSGPGCPVCVTAQRHIDAAIELGRRDGVLVATYGDMMRVPGRRSSLEKLRAGGAQIRVVNSPRTALDMAREHPDLQVAFLAVGFEATAPTTAATVLEADRDRIENFSVLMCHKLVVPAMMALLDADDAGLPELDGFLCPGHVSVIIGAGAYAPVVERHGKPCVVAGFEPEQILSGLVRLVEQVAGGTTALDNVYGAVASTEGNRIAQELLERVFVTTDAVWRKLGTIPHSGQELARPYRRFDAVERFKLDIGEDEDHPDCRCGEVIQGKLEPVECALFGGICKPQNPIGPCMVSSEGTCSAWYKYNRPAGAAFAPGGQGQGLAP